MVPTVTTGRELSASLSQMDGSQLLVLTTEISVTDGHITGSVRVAGQPDQAFSGWAELFAVLTTLVSDSGQGRTGDDIGGQRRADR